MVLNFALNYGGRAEITTAVQAVATQVKQGKLEPSQIDEKVFSEALMTAKLPYADPELLIRTSGEERISNFFIVADRLQ